MANMINPLNANPNPSAQARNAAPFENSTDPKDEAAARRVTRKRRGQADLERAVMERLGSNPAESTVRRLIKKPLEAWRRQYRPADN